MRREENDRGDETTRAKCWMCASARGNARDRARADLKPLHSPAPASRALLPTNLALPRPPPPTTPLCPQPGRALADSPRPFPRRNGPRRSNATPRLLPRPSPSPIPARPLPRPSPPRPPASSPFPPDAAHLRAPARTPPAFRFPPSPPPPLPRLRSGPARSSTGTFPLPPTSPALSVSPPATRTARNKNSRQSESRAKDARHGGRGRERKKKRREGAAGGAPSRVRPVAPPMALRAAQPRSGDAPTRWADRVRAARRAGAFEPACRASDRQSVHRVAPASARGNGRDRTPARQRSTGQTARARGVRGQNLVRPCARRKRPGK